MTSLHRSLVAILFYVLIKETISLDEIELLRNSTNAPIALIRDSTSLRWALAVPHYCDRENHLVGYLYDSSRGEYGPKQEFKPACPPYWPEEFEKEKNWKFQNNSPSSVNNKMFFTVGYVSPRMKCPRNVICEPSIQKIEHKSDEGDLNCGVSGAEMFGVGYPISLKNVKIIRDHRRVEEVQFLPVYTFCYSETNKEAKLWYTIHHIASPSLLLREEVREHYEPDLKDGVGSYFDKNLRNLESYVHEKHYLYNFVGADDMPTKVWEMTTSFLFNYTLILKNRDSFTGMMRVDHYIRLYSRLTNQPLNLYSGIHRTTEIEQDDNTPCFKIFCKSTPPTPVDVFWRVITTIDEKRAIVLVTQHSFKKCSKFHVCDENSARMVKEYEMGGCTYTCSVSWSTIELLGLPRMTDKADLDLTITTTTEGSEFTLKDGRRSSESNARFSQRVTDLIDFMNAENVQDAVNAAIAKAYEAKKVQNSSTPVDQVSNDRLLEQGIEQGKLKDKYLSQNG